MGNQLSSHSFSVTKGFGYIMAALVYEQVLNGYLTVKVVDARKKYDVKYPELYADRTYGE